MFYTYVRAVKQKRLSYAVNQFSVTLCRDNERTDGGRNYLLIVINAFN